MGAWFLNPVLGLSLPVLLLGLQGLLGAGTPGNSSAGAVTEGFSSSAATDELNHTEQNRSSALYSSESLSPSQRNILLSLPAETHTAAAGPLGTEQTQPYTEMSTRPLEALGASTEPLATAAVGVTTEASSRTWKASVSTEQASDSPPAVSWEAVSLMQTDTDSVPRDHPSTTLGHGEASSPVAHTDLHANSTFSSTTISRAGERTLLSVTSSSSSSAFTEDSMSRQPPSTWGVSAAASEAEDYTLSVTSSRADFTDATDQNVTRPFEGLVSDAESTGRPAVTQSINTQPNVSRHQHSSASEETSDSTPPLSVRETSTSQPEPAWTSSPSVTSHTEASTNASGTDQEIRFESSTESSTGIHISSTQKLEGTEMVSPHTGEQTVSFGPTAGLPTVSNGTPGQHSVTDTPGATEVTHTGTSTTATESRYYLTEESNFNATSSTTNVPPAVASPAAPTSSPWPSKTVIGATTGSATAATVLHTVPPSSSSTLAVYTSAAALTASPRPSAGGGIPTVPTPRTEMSTRTPELTTVERHPIPTTDTPSASTKSTEAVQTSRQLPDAGTTEPVATTPPATSTQAPHPPTPPRRNPCASNPCVNGGMCVSDSGHQLSCHCQQAWTGPTCNQDVDECEVGPCPVGSRCVNTQGSFDCECPLGFDLEDGRTCARAKTFLGTFSLNRLPHGRVAFRSSTVHEIQREIIQLLNASLSVLRGYSRSLLRRKEGDGIHILAVNMFSVSTDVTSAEVFDGIQMSLSNCSSSVAHCRMVLLHQLTYHVESLCVAQKTQCDTERSTCSDSSGTARCQCLQGYYKHNPDDLACLECGDGYKLENGTCVPCTFGFGGFNCGNFYKLIAVVVSPAGGALLLALVIALAVTCRKKDKNDLNKIIFKSGDLQMSPYADFPKSNRTSMEWGREAIEMQENGSTKNLLQMSDIYYSPALRNSDLERNGLYQFTGLPGSRHSCIYPAQWNPSFISDDSRRRDYF
ncbi:protein HEG isoform X1 [Takifugu rubripes]|uniref:Heart development protein with EGF-like domains 1 n=1 Tax=Takifugu rubripes TaxID=31033 RepID=H2SV75_TAKRU|nr:protein HEG homolog 1 isoform X1 [Takifugu rubripes]